MFLLVVTKKNSPCIDKAGGTLMNTTYSLSEVGRLLGIQGYRIAYAHTVGAIPEPQRFCGKRLYKDEDVKRVAAHFHVGMDSPDGEEGEGCIVINR
jgi:hypothetical protein